MHRQARVLDLIEVAATGRLHGEVAPAARAPKPTRRAVERSRDHASYCVLPGQDPASGEAVVVQLLLLHHVRMCGDLEDGVLRRVDDQLAGTKVPLAVVEDRAQPLRRRVADHAAARRALELGDHLRREPPGVHGEARHADAHHLPVPRGRVLPRPERPQPAVHGGLLGGLHAADRRHVSEAERLQGRHLEPPDRVGHVGERVRPLVAVLPSVG